MSTLIAEYTASQENRQSFDVLASVNLYRYDLAEFGYIRPETRQRVYDEELTYIAEGINRQVYTEFQIKRVNGELMWFHNGEWRPYLGTLLTGAETYNREAGQDPRKRFMAERAAEDLRIGYQMQRLSPGEKLSWYSDFPEQELSFYGEEYIKGLGFQPDRRMGFLYQAEAGADGSVRLSTQSVDNSDSGAFEYAAAIGRRGGSIDDMRAAYDESLRLKYGGEYFAGRPEGQEENAWDVVTRNRDLIEDYFLTQIEEMAAGSLNSAELIAAKKRLTYGVWAALKERLDDTAGTGVMDHDYSGYGVQEEVDAAFDRAAARGDALIGCGGAIEAERATMWADSKSVFDMIFGGEKKWFSCPFCGAKQYGDPCAVRLYCGACTAEARNGKIVSKGNGSSRTPRKGFIEIFMDGLEEWNRNYDYERARKKAIEQARQKEEAARLSQNT